MTYANWSSPCKPRRTKIDVIDVYASFRFRLFYKHTEQEVQIPKNKKNKAVHQDVRYDRSYT